MSAQADTAVIKDGFLHLKLPIQTPTPSASGKTLVVASTHGNQATATRPRPPR